MRGDREGGSKGSWHAAVLMGALAAAAWPGGGGVVRAEDDVAAEAVPPLGRGDYHFDRDGLARVPSPVREALEAFIAAEYALERPATPERLATGFVEALVEGGLSEEEAVRTAATFVNLGNQFTFVDRRRMTRALAASYPAFPMPDGLVPSMALPDAPLPPGGVMVTCTDGLDPDSLRVARWMRQDPSWSPRNAFDVAIECNVQATLFAAEAPGVTGEDDTLRVTASMELVVERPGEERRTLRREDLAYAEAVTPADRSVVALAPSATMYVPRSAFPLPDDARLLLEVRYDVVHHAPGVPAEKRATIGGRVLYRVVPRLSADRVDDDPSAGVERLEVVPLGPDRKDLACPEVVHDYRVPFNITAFVLSGKDAAKAILRQRAAAERKHASVLGRDLVSVPLLRAADGTSGELSLPADRTHLLIFGATWCGPCRALAPSVEAFVAAIADRDDAPVVHRLSIDDDPESFDAALAAHASGVCADAFEEEFVVDAVPKYFLIRGGKLVEQGIVDERRIEGWRRTYAP